MPIIKSFSPKQNLSSFVTFLNDTDPNSRYFRISEFGETFTGGRNGFLIEGSEFLKPSTEVKIEILDVNKNPIYFTPGDGIPEYYEGVSKLISVEVYDDTPIGLGKITVLGELEKYVNEDGNVVDVPDEWKGVYNVKWEKEFKINKNLSNESIVRFVKRPKISITEIEKPSFTKTIPQVTQNGIASGEPSIPAKGTNLSNYTAGTLYKINITDSSNFTSSIDENIISFPSINYNPTVKEVLSEKTVLVDVPFTIDGLVSDFKDVSYTTTFEDLENTVTEQTTITGSFAEIFINDLKTFVGDVARVKVYRKSKNEVGDFTLVTDTRLESTEMLKDITVATDTELSYGSFSPSNFSSYWVTSSNDHVVSFDNTQLFSSIRVDYNNGLGGTQLLHTSRSLNFNTDVEYTLKFKTLLSGSITSDKSLKAFISGTNNFTQSFIDITPDATYNQRQDISANLISQYSGSGQLYFEFQGDDWYLSNVSLKNAQETSFSPDEFTLIQEVPRKLPSETFDFRFEFYDINNNFIPVEVFATKEFNGGNTASSQAVKFLSFESDRTAFRFTTGSIGNPAFQQVAFTVTSNGVSGSVTFASSAFDTDGNYIDPSSYGGDYPGGLINVSDRSATLLIGNFTGSVESVTVGSIIYTASADDLQDFESIFRFEDGENAPALFATTNTNQFIYEPTHLEPKPLVQDLRIQVKRKNLASLITPITANSSSDVPLTEVVDEGGIKTFSLSATEFSSSIISGNDGPYDSVTYSFTASGEFGNEFSDEVTISPVINFDAVSIVLSNESTTFRANSVGSILDNLSEGNGTVSMNIGNQSISHNDGLNSRNTFDIVSVSGTNVTPLSASPTTNLYGISAMSADNGTIDITVDYLAGDNATSQSFSKKVNYGKNRSAPPTIELTTTNKTQNVSANSSGVQDDSFEDSTITVQEFYTGSSKTFGSSDVTIDFQSNPSSIATDNGNLTISLANLADGTNSANVIFSASVVDSEGTSRDIVDSISLSKSPAGQDGEGRIVSLTFTDNSIAYNADGTNPTPSSITMEASSSGFTSPVFKFTGGDTHFTDETSFTAGTGANDSATFTAPTSIISTPLTFQVEVQEASDASSNAIDRESVIFVKPGQDTRPRFFIKPLNGTQIKNASGNLELQVVRTDSTGSFDISGSAQGNAEIYSGSVKLSTSLTGITDGGNGAQYNPVIAPSAISGTLELTLQETDGTVLDSITLVDVTDGLGGGSFLVPNGLVTKRNPNDSNSFTPSTMAVTASFFDATGSEFRKSVLITPSFTGLDKMAVSAASGDSQITITANDGDDGTITLGGSPSSTKDVNIVALFTEPGTGKTNTITETFYIVSEGQDGTSAKSVRLSADAQAFIEAKDGTVTPSTITFTANRQNITESTVFSSSMTLGGSGDTATLTATEFGSATTETIRATADSLSDEITIVRLIEGSDGITIINTNQAHTFPSNPTGSVLDYGGSGTTISAFEGINALSFDGIGTSAGTFTVSVSQSPNGAFSSVPGGTDDGDSVTFGNYGSLSDSVDLVTVTYTLTGKRLNGNAFSGSTTQTFTKSKEGPEAVQVTNTNTSVAVASDSDGLNPDLTDSGTEIQVFEGVNELTFTTGTPTTGQYSASAADTNITVGTFSGNGTTTFTVGDHTLMNADNAKITYTLKGVRANGNDFTTSTTQNLTKVRAGSDGADGADAEGKTVKLLFSDSSVTYNADGTNPDPASITMEASSSGFTSPRFKFTGGGSNFTDETSFTAGTGDNDSATFTSPTSIINTPLTFQVEVIEDGDASDNAIDRESIIFVKPGQDTRPRFIIKPLNGTQIKNAQGNLELQVVRIDGSGSFDVSGSGQITNDAKIFSGSVALSTSLTGITDGGNGAEYNPVIAPSAISGTLELTLKEDDGTILDSINLLDVTDGLGGGSFLVPNGLLMRRSGSVYTPSSLGVTASFFDATGSEFRADVSIGSNFNGTLDQMNVTAGTTNPQISFTANDGDNNNIPLNATFANTKDVNIVATFTESGTGKTNTITETFFIVSDGQDGTSAKSIRLSSSHQSFIQAKDGTITPDTITFTSNRQNTDDTTTTFSSSPSVTLGGSGDTATLTKGNFGSNTSVTVTATADSSEVSDEITIVKLVEGSDALTIVNTNQAHTVTANSLGVVNDLTNSGTTIKVFEGTASLDYDQSGTTAGHFRVSTTVSPSSAVTLATLPDGTSDGDSCVILDHTAMANGEDVATITYTLTGKRFNGDDFSVDTTQTITKSKEGKDALQIVNTNSSVTVPSDSDGTNTVLTGTGTTIQLFEGATQLDYDATGTSAGHFTVATSVSPSSAITLNTLPDGNSDGNDCVISDHIGMSNSENSATITYTISGQRLDGTSFTSLVTKQTITKAKAGTDGSGANAVSVTPNITSQNVTRTISVSPNTFTTVTNITFSVVEGSTTFSAIPGSSTLSNSTYKVKTSNLVNCTEPADGVISPTQPSLSSPNGFTATFTIQYKDSSGNENEIDFSHVVTVTPEGDTGPGIVHTGVWESARVYQFGTGATGRRDSVLWESTNPGVFDTYYGATSQHTSTYTQNTVTGIPGSGVNTPWENLGEQDLFVAAKIGIFEDSFIQNTLNVGSSNNGGVSSANITIFGGTDSGGSANPYISMGQAGTTGAQGYSVGGGIFLGSDSNDDKFKLSIEGTISVYKFESLGEDEFVAAGAFSDHPNSFTTTLYGSEPVLDENTTLYTNIGLSNTFDGDNRYYSDRDTVVRINGSGVVTPQSGYTSTSPNSVGVSTSTNSLKWNGDELQIVGDINVTGGNAATGDQASSTVVYFDDFSIYPTVADVTSAGDDPKTDGSGQGYFAYENNGELSLETGEGELFGKAFKIGNNSGNDYSWFSGNRLIPFNENSLYEMEIRIKETAGTGTHYAGITAYKKDGTTKVKVDGTSSFGSQHYFVLSNASIGTEFTTYRGYFKGTSSSGNGGLHSSKDDPGTIHVNALNGFFTPNFIAQYLDATGITYVDYIKITEFNVGGGSTRISGDSIKTGQIKSNNLTSDAGSVLDLNAGTIKLGGTSDPNFEVTSAGHVTAKGGGSIAGWDITDSQLQSSNLSGGGDGSFTTQGILINTNGYISAKNFFISSDGLPKFNGVLTSTSGSLGGWQLNDNALTSPDGIIELSSTGKSISIKRSNGEIDLTLKQGGLSDLNADTESIAWILDEYSRSIRSSTESQLKVTSTTNFDSSVRFANNSTDSFVLTDVGTYTLASPNFQMRGILSDAGSLELETGVGGFDIGDQEYTITLGYAIVTNPGDKEGSVVYRNNNIGSVTLTSGSSGVTGGDTTFTVNDTISIGNTSVSTTYYLYGLLSLDGTVSGGTLDVDAIFNAKSGINFVKALDIVELTGEGIQIAKSSTRYVQIPKTTLTKVLTLGGGLMIHQGGTGTANGITFTSGSSDADEVEWRIHKGGGQDLFLQYKNPAGTVQNTHTFTDNGNFDILGSVGSISSRKIKENIINLPSQKEIIEKLQPVHYTKIINNQEEIGLIAEDVHEIIPNLVSYDKQGNPNGIFYSKLSVVLLDVVKRQGKEIEELKQRLDNLENI
jgi:hypothetical protein